MGVRGSGVRGWMLRLRVRVRGWVPELGVVVGGWALREEYEGEGEGRRVGG